MTERNNLATQPINWVSLVVSMSIGAGIALAIISLFLVGVNNPDPAWGKYWMIRPLLVVPTAGATGGACYYFINRYLNKNTAGKILAFLLGLIVYIMGLWIGTVLGLDGTLWD